MSVFFHSADKCADVLGIQFTVNFLLSHIFEFYKNSQVISILVKMGQKMDTCHEDLHACLGTIPAHMHLSSYDKDKEENEKK